MSNTRIEMEKNNSIKIVNKKYIKRINQSIRQNIRQGIRTIVIFGLFFLSASNGYSQESESNRYNRGDSALFPQGQLFYPSMASPKEPRTHVTYLKLKLPDESLETINGVEPDDTINIGSVGFGDSFGLVRWSGWGDNDAWQLNISGTVLAQFNMDADSMDLINADYIIGFPLSYRNGFFSARARFFHQSSHLGDEFLLLPQIEPLKVSRINLSFETIELLAAVDWNGIQLSAGPSYIVHTDSDLKRNSFQASIDYQSRKPVFKPTMRLFTSIMWHSWEETDWDSDFNAKVGINIRSPYTEKRAIQIFGEYYNGNLPFGQFYKLRSEYYGAGINVSF
ncbi:MAG: DUF1207 domain-containing protein [Desulfamplus sp.]|nr:DUF1207 domain-containing protein [Desulfamplus sp.]